MESPENAAVLHEFWRVKPLGCPVGAIARGMLLTQSSPK